MKFNGDFIWTECSKIGIRAKIAAMSIEAFNAWYVKSIGPRFAENAWNIEGWVVYKKRVSYSCAATLPKSFKDIKKSGAHTVHGCFKK